MIAAARVAGCTCRQPDAELVKWYSEDAQHVALRHDAGCAALNSGRQLVLLPPERRS